MSKKVTFLVAVMAVMSLALSAVAAPSVDTLLTAGYDSDEMALVFGYTDYEEGMSEACASDGEVTFSPTTTTTPESSDSTDGDGAEGLATPVETADELDGDCPEDFYAIDATGPDGQENHGTVTSSFVHAVKELDGAKGIGCLVSSLNSLKDLLNVGQVEDGGASVEASLTLDEETTDYLVELFSADPTRCGKPDKSGNPTSATLDGDTDDAKGPAWKATGENPGKGKGKNK